MSPTLLSCFFYTSIVFHLPILILIKMFKPRGYLLIALSVMPLPLSSKITYASLLFMGFCVTYGQTYIHRIQEPRNLVRTNDVNTVSHSKPCSIVHHMYAFLDQLFKYQSGRPNIMNIICKQWKHIKDKAIMCRQIYVDMEGVEKTQVFEP